METLPRKTINFDARDSQVVGPYLKSDTDEHAALEALAGRPLSSDSAELKALLFLGVQRVQEKLLEDAYNRSVAAGDFEDTETWAKQVRGRRRPRD